MIQNQKINYTALFLIFCVASSKGIIIYNEEILVALSFVLFFVFSKSYFGNTIKESFDERNSVIREQALQFYREKESSLLRSDLAHKTLKKAKESVSFIQTDAKQQISLKASYTNLPRELENRLGEQIQQKFNLSTSPLANKRNLQSHLQNAIVEGIIVFVLDKTLKKQYVKGSVSKRASVEASLSKLAIAL